MGFKNARRTYKIVVDDGEYEGLEVRLRGLSVRQLMEVEDTANEAESGKPESAIELFSKLSENIVSWNLEDDDGAPIGHSVDDLLDLDMSFVLFLVQEWLTAAAGVAVPLGKGSNSGPKLPETSIGMESL